MVLPFFLKEVITIIMADNGSVNVPPQIRQLIDDGALFVINDSGGKDSQVMKIKLAALIPKHQLVIIHSHLPEVEWPGVKEHIEKYAFDIPVYFTEARKTFFEMVLHRNKFPDMKNRQCTSDLKRGPIQKFINNYCRENRFLKVVNCIGLRAEESSSRAKKEVVRFRTDLSAKHRIQYEWLPIHDFTLSQVWNCITLAGQYPHWAYSKGMSRLSCCFCIMSSESDLKTAATLMPELLERYSEIEERTGFTFIMPSKKHGKRTLKQIVNQ